MSCTGDSGVPTFFLGVRLRYNTKMMLKILETTIYSPPHLS